MPALLTLEVEVKLTLRHRWDVRQGEVHRSIRAIGVVDDAVIAIDLLPLEGRTSPPLLATLVAKDRDDGENCVLGEPLSWEG